MDDIGFGIKRPAVIDFKIGRKTYDPEETIEKIDRQKKKYPAVERIGFQLIGMRVSGGGQAQDALNRGGHL